MEAISVKSMHATTVSKVRTYLAGLASAGRALPSYHGRVSLSAVAKAIGLTLESLKMCGEARKLIDSRTAALGLDDLGGRKHGAIKIRIAAYAKAKRESGGTVPRDPRMRNRISHVGVGAEVGIPKELHDDCGLQRFLKEQLEGIPLGEPYQPSEAAVPPAGRKAERLAAFEKYLVDNYEATGTPLPESLNQPGLFSYEVIRAEHPIPIAELSLDTPIRRRLLAAIEKVGLAPRMKAAIPRITYGELTDAALGKRSSVTKETKTGSQAVRNLASAIKRLLASRGRSREDHCDQDLTADLDDTLAMVTRDVVNPRTARKLTGEVRFLADVHRELLKALDLPGTFHEALRELIGRSRITAPFVELRTGISRGLVASWMYGLTAPSAASAHLVEKVEVFLGVGPGTLSRLLPRPSGRRASLAGDTSLSKQYGSHVVRHLPLNFLDRNPEEQAEIVEQVRNTIMVQDSTFSRGRRARLVLEREAGVDEYALKEADWPETPRAEWRLITSFKTSRLTPSNRKRETEAVWNPATAKLNLRHQELFFGYVVMEAAHGGLGIPAAMITAALLASTFVVRAYLEWRFARRGDQYNTGDHKMLVSLLSLIRPEVGVIAQEPSWAGRLAVIETIDPEAVSRAKADWTAYCVQTHAEIAALADDVEREMVMTRDPFEPILGLLEHPDPREAYAALIRSMDDRCPDERTSPTYYHVHLRDRVIAHLALQSALRNKNLRELTWRPDNTGHLRRRDGNWWLFIPRKQFKNSYSSYFGLANKKVDYTLELHDDDGLFPLLEEYVAHSRPHLMHGASTDVLFVPSTGRPFNHQGFDQCFRSITRKHFAWNPFNGVGMQGVMPHGVHHVRDIVATDVLKHTGRYDLAAWAIQDTEATTRKAYGRFLVEDKHKLLEQWRRNRRGTTSQKHLQVDLQATVDELQRQLSAAQNQLRAAQNEISQVREQNRTRQEEQPNRRRAA